jgi:DegV family protein with EDD domain
VTDEIADLLPKIAEKYQIEVVPYKIDWPEGKNLGGDNIYQKMREAEKSGIKNLPKTSQASPKEFLEVYQKQLEKFDKVLCIPLGSKLSGGYNSACQAKEMLPEEQRNKVYVLDSFQATGGQALLILKAIELIQSQMEINEVIRELKKWIQEVRLYGFMADPKWLEWGGRLSPKLANWIRRFQKIHLYPFIGLKQGEVKPIGITRAKDLVEGLFKQIEKDSKKIRKQGKKIRVVITHCDNLEDAERLKVRLKEIKAEVSFINLTSPVVGVHVGPGSLTAAWVPIE